MKRSSSIKGVCRLCDENRCLQESHIIPSFVGKWLKKSSSTGFLSGFETTSGAGTRTQDIYKKYLLCADCERTFSAYETYFANNIFYPHKNNKLSDISQNPFISKFVVSVSLRSLWIFQDINDPIALSNLEEFHALEQEWKDYVIDKEAIVKGVKSHHLLFANEDLLAHGLKVAPNLIFNTFRSSIFEIKEYFGKPFIFVNMAGVQIISMLSYPDLPNSSGSMVYPIQELGVTAPGIGWGGYFQNIVDFSNYVDTVRYNLSEKEKQKIYSAESKRPERSVNSEDTQMYVLQQSYVERAEDKDPKKAT